MTETPTTPQVPAVGEVWQDSEGALLFIVEEGRFSAFDTDRRFTLDDLSPTDRPAKRVFDIFGNYVGDGPLDYPTGSVFRRRQPQVTFGITVTGGEE